jgi:hypothetical protein
MMMKIPTRDTETAIPAIAPVDRFPLFGAGLTVDEGEEVVGVEELELEDEDEVDVVEMAKLYPLTGTPKTV